MATTNLTGRTGVVIDLKNVENLATKLKEVLDELNINSSIKWSFGTGIKQADVLLHEKLTIAAGANQTLNLYDTAASALQDAFGNDLTMEAIKLLFVLNRSTDLYVELFGGGSLDLLIMGGTTDALKVKPEGLFFWQDPSAAGIDVTTNKNLKFVVAAGSGDAIIDVVALGLD
jgi:hypothetical protein